MTIIVAVFFLKLRVVLGSCFGMHRLDVSATAGPEAFSFLSLLFLCWVNQGYSLFAEAAACSHTVRMTLTLPPRSLLVQDPELGIGLIQKIQPSIRP